VPTIRLATPGDAEQLQTIYALYCLTPISFEAEPPTVEEMRGRLAKVLDPYPWLICEDSGPPSGEGKCCRPLAPDDRAIRVAEWRCGAVASYVGTSWHTDTTQPQKRGSLASSPFLGSPGNEKTVAERLLIVGASDFAWRSTV
jgi:hypothetical protein